MKKSIFSVIYGVLGGAEIMNGFMGFYCQGLGSELLILHITAGLLIASLGINYTSDKPPTDLHPEHTMD